MNQLAFLLISITGIWLVGALLPVFWRKMVNGSLGLALLASMIAAGYSAAVWLGFLEIDRVIIPFNLWEGMAFLDSTTPTLPALQLEFSLDSLSAFFVFLIASFAVLVSIYSFKALQATHYRDYAHWISSSFNLFVWSTVMVVVAHDGFSLIISLEIMTLSFAYLTLYKHFLYQDEDLPISDENSEKKKKAGIAPHVYLIISHASTAFLLVALLLLAINSNSFSYLSFVANARGIEGNLMASMVFLLALAGLGIRVGLTPSHIWTSLVHPASPTTTHAFSLGVAIKVGVYLMYRFFFQFLVPQMWWGYLLLGIAVTTALVNVWYAISSHDLKEALAYHSIENIGIITAGIGIALIFWDISPAIAYLGILGSLYHLLNHAVFKGGLYFATGAVDNLTHQNVNIDYLGGLIHKYRFTASVFLIFSFAISGFPPLNGFVSEWIILQAGLGGLSALGDNIFPFVVVLTSLFLLVVSFALTAFCFYKIAGVAFLGMPRLSDKKMEHWAKDDVPNSMKAVMGVMAILSFLLGVFPGIVAPQLEKAFAGLLGISSVWKTDKSFLAIRLPELPAFEFADLPIASFALTTLIIVLFLVILRLVYSVKIRHTKLPWDCGEAISEPPVQQYTSGALSFSLRKLFLVLNPVKTLTPSEKDYLPSNLVLSKNESSPLNQRIVVEVFRREYNKIIDGLFRFSKKIGDTVQNGDIRRYLQYVFWVNIIILIIFWITSSFLLR